ncbi:MAG: hypothetical protein IPJ48_04835 [Propionivibrio sp.]|uniref:Lipoprotein n=1 Tax=Candidatus Propionivibrio dominans TaxID=2954373 RepID=A0A9D7I7V1_9RHOO|nr:hypothetical protein [Candidatus Propionivibrio dominans]MBL0166318.1 hypothetical protein [Propionivibrio sp.]
MTKLTLLIVIVVATTLASGCATVTKGTTQPVTLHTDPDGATCDVTRELKNVASLSATPGQVIVDKAWGSIDVSCRKSGHQPTEVRVDSEVQGWTFGNILIGGIIGFALDAASGAMRQYPQFIMLTLVPEEFASAEDRDRYLSERLSRFEEEAAKATQLLDKNCSADACAAERMALQETKERRVALLRERVDKARIRAPAAAGIPSAKPSDAPPAAKLPEG